ncbi:hypothetical protein FE697_012295 [Mumia zhuanghuii]|uniref:DUF4157 domain-containing protein n=2 Tax=Mumia TaxID=1546255 RepID=A0ABW1QGJ7_9ACTN|nr:MULTISPECIES: hypothetical protein [Mumia]KAA1422916.1 hypothetical protein FE697_012295 [Mumia zhuanghuii]
MPSAEPLLPHTAWTRVRTAVNWINLSTVLGLLTAWVGGAQIRRRGRGTYVATGYRWRIPAASAFTVGSVIVSRHGEERFARRPALLLHEDRHCTQYAWCLGPVMLPLYFAGVGVSYVVAGDHWSYNPFERLAVLVDGDYRPNPPRWRR